MNSGTYLAEVKDCKVGKDKKGFMLITLKIEVIVEGGKEILYKNLSFSGKAKEYSLKALAICGWHGTTTSDLIGSENFQPVEIEVVVVDEEYNGKMHPVISFINVPGGGGNFKGLSKDELLKSGMEEDLASQIKNLGVEPRVVGGSDIPF
jgi:hypothetical protein